MNAQTTLAASQYDVQAPTNRNAFKLTNAMNRQDTLHHYEFREVTDAAGLEELFRLRYRCFRNSKIGGLVPENEFGLDIDCYDLRSRHYGLYENLAFCNRLIGTIRHVADSEQSTAPAIRSIVESRRDLVPAVEVEPEHPFPVLEHWSGNEPIYSIYWAAKSRGEMIIEAGRLALDPSLHELELVNFIFRATIANYRERGGKQALLRTSANRKRFYARYGFHCQEQIGDQFATDANTMASLLIWDYEQISPTNKAKIEDMQAAIRKGLAVGLCVQNKQIDEEK